ncbi:hypothetical protein M3Y95_00537000 [Aphelenchoides besseyi]|nr:hypothetical protein M3Y95_00537000 [Aphelenchoides besseyi]
MVVTNHTTWYVFKKRASCWVVPGICFSLIFIDWFHTYQWKRGQKKSVIDELLGEEMGTFTFRYAIRTWFKNTKNYLIPMAAAGYLGHCWDKNGEHKTLMMKGKSKMYAHVHAAVPKGKDIWNY